MASSAFKLLQFNKLHETIDKFSDLLQKTLNESNDLVKMEAFESSDGDRVYVAMTFATVKTEPCELIAFFSSRVLELEDQINSTIAVAYSQSKQVLSVNLVPYSKSPRALGFLVLQKVKETVDETTSQDQKREAQARKQNSKTNAKTNPAGKN